MTIAVTGDDDDDRDESGDEPVRRLQRALKREHVRPCPCECATGGFCGGCGHAGCQRR